MLFSIVALPIYIPTKSTQGFPFLHILANIYYFCLFDNSCLFILLMLSFAVQMLFSLMLSYLLIFAFGIKSKKTSPRPMSRNLPPMFSSRSFMVSGLMFGSLINLELIFMYCLR